MAVSTGGFGSAADVVSAGGVSTTTVLVDVSVDGRASTVEVLTLLASALICALSASISF